VTLKHGWCPPLPPQRRAFFFAIPLFILLQDENYPNPFFFFLNIAWFPY
jgi:hypothetical protein